MTHKELVDSLTFITDSVEREILMAQYIVSLEQQLYTAKLDLAKERTVKANQNVNVKI